MNKKIILVTLIYLGMCGGICWYCLGGDIVRDLSGYMKINPRESVQSWQAKQGYNLNQYLVSQDRRTLEAHNNAVNTIGRTLDILSRPESKGVPCQK